ncbi:hypothetical protein SBFV3_gp37 [Sulfolobales Beppu filamentous virus 3]|uniref:Uncharacterized protein n=1 Tax=Sulfolobales Beppu filamentous virus 3 TaxID=2493124 RepID=A0A3Q8Q3W4_9VIRU|nr:hypothetical protein HOU83_gp37 [Sulfolobales Beppu filamentous virus 3]AZI75872.1 hypothetical protein SBFV3_gp37 [Sulfolobales Beppu filamentous virus 3]
MRHKPQVVVNMTVSSEYVALLKQILVNGYGTVTVYSSGYYSSATSVTFQLPTSITIVVLNNGNVVAQSIASISSVTESGGELSVTFTTTFNTTFNGNEIRLYASYGTTLIYLIAYAYLDVTSSPSNPLVIEWTITIETTGEFNVIGVQGSPQALAPIPLVSSKCCSINTTVFMYPYLVHLIIAYTLIPSPSYIIQTQFPTIPLAVMLQSIPQPSNATQFYGITAVAVTCQSQNVNIPVYCGEAENGTGNIVFLYTPNNCNTPRLPSGYTQCQSPTALALYQLGTVYLAILQAQLYTIPQQGSAITVQAEITIG